MREKEDTYALMPELEDTEKRTGDLDPKSEDMKERTGDLNPESEDMKERTGDLNPESEDAKKRTSDLNPKSEDAKKHTVYTNPVFWNVKNKGKKLEPREGGMRFVLAKSEPESEPESERKYGLRPSDAFKSFDQIKDDDTTMKKQQKLAENCVNELANLKGDALRTACHHITSCNIAKGASYTTLQREILHRIQDSFVETLNDYIDDDDTYEYEKDFSFTKKYTDMLKEFTNSSNSCAFFPKKDQQEEWEQALEQKQAELEDKEKLFLACQYVVKNRNSEDSDEKKLMNKLINNEFLAPYMAVLMQIEENEIRGRKENAKEYLDAFQGLHGRLKKTLSRYSEDSPQFNELYERMSLFAKSEKTSFNGNMSADEKLAGVSELRSCAKRYINYCAKHYKSGSRRATRLKNAERIVMICEAYEHGKSPKEYLRDALAEEILRGQSQRLLEQSDSAFHGDFEYTKSDRKDLYTPTGQKLVKWQRSQSAFKTLSKSSDLFDLYHLYENKANSYSKYTKLYNKELEKTEKNKKSPSVKKKKAKQSDDITWNF